VCKSIIYVLCVMFTFHCKVRANLWNVSFWQALCTKFRWYTYMFVTKQLIDFMRVYLGCTSDCTVSQFSSYLLNLCILRLTFVLQRKIVKFANLLTTILNVWYIRLKTTRSTTIKTSIKHGKSFRVQMAAIKLTMQIKRVNIFVVFTY
jgi:hypothetical protein